MATATQISDPLLLLGNENCSVCQLLLRLRQPLKKRRPLFHSLIVARNRNGTHRSEPRRIARKASYLVANCGCLLVDLSWTYRMRALGAFLTQRRSFNNKGAIFCQPTVGRQRSVEILVAGGEEVTSDSGNLRCRSIRQVWCPVRQVLASSRQHETGRFRAMSPKGFEVRLPLFENKNPRTVFWRGIDWLPRWKHFQTPRLR